MATLSSVKQELQSISCRRNRLNSDDVYIRGNIKITNENAINLIRPLTESKVSYDNFVKCIYVLESIKDTMVRSNIVKMIKNSICEGLITDDLSNITLDNFSITDEEKDQIQEGLINACRHQRVLTNQDMLSKRFNIDKVVRENIYNPDRIIKEICEFIDTYNQVLPKYKLNIALENITYSLYSNGCECEASHIVDKVLEYFLLGRDMQIDDNMYQSYQKVLQENIMMKSAIKNSSFASVVLDNSGEYFREKQRTILSVLKDSSDILTEEAMSIKTEQDADNYMELVKSEILSGITESDLLALLNSVSNIDKYTDVSKYFIKINSSSVFDKCCDFDYHDVIDCKCGNTDKKDEELFGESVFTNYLNKFNEAYADTEDIKKVINKFKVEQEKSPNKIKAFIEKLHTKSPEVIIDDIPDIMRIVRVATLVCIAALTPIGPVVAAILGLVSWLLSKQINDKEATRLLNTIRSEKKKMQDKLNNLSDGKKKQEIEKYIESLKACEDKVVKYLDDIEDKDHSDPDDDLDDDFDFDLESSLLEVSYVAEAASNILDFDASNLAIFNRIEECAKSNILGDVTELVKESSISISDYKNILKEAYNNSEDPIIRTAINSSIEKLDKYPEDRSIYRSIVAADIANKALYEASYEVINEFKLSTVKLALQNAKAKLKDLSTKEKSMWQSVDAAGSGVIRAIEKALTSDRREAIIKGSLIPSFSKCVKGAIALAGVGLFFGPLPALVTAITGLATSKYLNHRERQLIYDEIDTELEVVKKEIEIAQNDGDMKKYRFLLNYQKKLTREMQRIRYGIKTSGRNLPPAVLPDGKE